MVSIESVKRVCGESLSEAYFIIHSMAEMLLKKLWNAFIFLFLM